MPLALNGQRVGCREKDVMQMKKRVTLTARYLCSMPGETQYMAAANACAYEFSANVRGMFAR